jgi:hypothetical protein
LAYDIEEIANDQSVCRLIDAPRMTADGIELIHNTTFPFSKKRGGEIGYEGESISWDKYAPPPEEVHKLGIARQAAKRASRPEVEMAYAGFIRGSVGAIRELKTARGHGFSLQHVPSEAEGIHHAEIYYLPDPNGASLSPSDRVELREALVKAFGPLVPPP